LNATKTTAEIELKINQEYEALGNVDKEIEALQNRLAEYEGKVKAQQEKIQNEEADRIMADIREEDRTRQRDREDRGWRQGFDSLFNSGSIADAIAKATAALNIEQARESEIRDELGYAMANNDPESMRRLADDLRHSQSRQEYISQAIEKADKAQKGSEASAGKLGSFITADILNLLGGPSRPEEETAKNTRATVSNLAALIELIRSREEPAFT
jgi:hypothetical protein